MVPVSVRRRLWFRRKFGVVLHLARPSTFNEKVNWRIINDRRPLLEGTCDKLVMKERALSSVPGRVRVARTLWAGTDVSELAGVDLPERWVLKPNHRTGLVYFGEGRADVADLLVRTRGWADGQHWRTTGEWAYRSARPCLLVEEFIGVPGEAPLDYKVLVFDGAPRLVTVHGDRFGQQRTAPYEPDWTPLPYTSGPSFDRPIARPHRLGDMLACAARLAEGFDMLRVDFYEQDGELWFGELTPYPGSGMIARNPQWDALLGSWWTIPPLDRPVRRALRGVTGRLIGAPAVPAYQFARNVTSAVPGRDGRAVLARTPVPDRDAEWKSSLS